MEETLEIEKTLKISGMMCSHCEKTVKKALQEVPEVHKVIEISHSSGLAKIRVDSNVSDDQLKKAVKDSGFMVESIS